MKYIILQKIDKFFINKIDRLVRMEDELQNKKLTPELLLKAKKMGYTDKVISRLTKIKRRRY